ncbi:MAG TPA: NfeD family protein [Lachnospiraceae bacterium]|nr:NfeD family protein [Lachnospiraceae bacterium]
MDALVWLGILIVMLVIEIVTLGLTTIWFAGGALIAFVLAMFGANLWVQIPVFFVVSLVLLFVTRPIAVKYFNKDRVKTNAESLIGLDAIVISGIDNLQGVGQVTVAGQEWSAKASDDSVKYPVGSVVKIIDIKGVKVIVKEKEN